MKIPKFLFHITDQSNLSSIKKKGLIPRKDYILYGTGEYDKKGINLTSTNDNDILPIIDNGVILKIDASKLNRNRF